MDKSTVINYVCEHAMVQETVIKNIYFVRFPNPHSSKNFQSDDPEGLVENIWNFIQTNEGKKLINGLDFSAYLDENYNSEGE